MENVVRLPTARSSTLTSALELAARGFRVFPLAHGSNKPPKGFFGFQEQASTDPDKIRQLWSQYPGCNVGVATGKGVLVIDVDVKNGKKGADSLEALEAMGLPLDGYRVKTPSGGVHIFLKTDHPHRQIIDSLEGLPGIDIKCEGNYVVGAGSIRREFAGIPYEANGRPMPAAPEWLDTLLINARPQHAERTDQPLVELDQPHNIDNAITYLVNRAPQAIEGAGGDTTTYKIAGRMRDYGLSESKAWEVMLDHWNEQKASPVWDAEELLTVVQNAYRYATGAWGGEDMTAWMEVVEGIDDERPSADGETVADDAPPHTRRRNRFLSYDEMISMPEPEWLVGGVLPSHGASLLFGKSNTFKSFTAIDLALSVVSGRNWHGQRVKQGRAALIATEGANGVGRFRVPGWFNHYDVPLETRRNFFLMPYETAVDDKKSVNELLADVLELGDLDLIVFDIFGGTMLGSETEDTTARAWVHGIQRLMRKSGAATLTVAHTGWGDQTRARMHTHFWGSFDTRIRAEGDKIARTSSLTIERHKDFDSSGAWGFRLEKRHGTLIPMLDEGAKPSAAEHLSAQQKNALQALHAAVLEQGERRHGDGWPAEPVVPIELWKERAQPVLASSNKPDTLRRVFNRAKAGLIERGLVGEHDGNVWAIL